MSTAAESIEKRFRLDGDEVLSGLLWRGGGEQSGSWFRRFVLCALVAWAPLLILTLVAGSAFGNSVSQPFLSDPIPYARLLAALPLFLLAESFVDRRTTEAVRYLKASAVIPAEHRDAWQAVVARIGRLGDSRVPGVVMVVLALAMSWATTTHLAETERAAGIGSSWFWRPTLEGEEATWAGLWYVLVSNCIYCFLGYRWIWRFALWNSLLWRLSRIPLRLQPTHPDRAGGLGFLWRTQGVFLVMVAGFSASLSGALAYEIMYEEAPVVAQQPVVVGFVVGGLIVVFAPLLFFAGQLVLARDRALAEYSALGEDLSSQFRAAWIENPRADTTDLIVDSVHPSSVGDYSAVFGAVTSMRVFAFGLQGLATAVALLAAPFVPLLLLEMPLKDLFRKLIGLLA